MNKLQEINHIVVLMLENRSFDHLLGYLSLEKGRKDIDGLNGNQSIKYKNVAYSPKLLSDTAFEPDPHHDTKSVEEQLGDNNSGFIKNFATLDKKVPQRIMGYYNSSSVPVYDHLASEFCVCDRWFSSVQGQTQPNRIFSLAGHSNGNKDNLSNSDLILHGWDVKPIFKFLPKKVSWKYYSHDIASLRYVKGYQLNVKEIDKIKVFYDDAKNGLLPNVSWIDPNFGSGFYLGPASDDHPKHDIHHGQNLVRRVYNALLTGPQQQWEKTLLVVLYDEHGGFYDHVVPPGCVDDRDEFRQYGVRVPALVISPWAGKRVCMGSQQNIVFDHTSILKTILLRFCRKPDGSIPHMSSRVDAANDLSVFLTELTPRKDCIAAPDLPFKISFDESLLTVKAMGGNLFEELSKTTIVPEAAKVSAAEPPSDLQQSLAALSMKAYANGVPPDKI